MHAQVPEMIHYQGKVTVEGEAFDGTGQFKFALVDDGTANVTTATAKATVTDGFVTSFTVTDGGAGYFVAPEIVITGGGGSGATATAVVGSAGQVLQIDVNSPGSGYTGPDEPEVTGGAPPADLRNPLEQ